MNNTINSVFVCLLFLVCIKADYYYKPGETKTWNDAVKKCESMEMELATLTTEQEYQDAVNIIKNGNDVWIGMSSDGTEPFIYKWTNGQSVSWTYWGNGEPNAQSTDKCIRLKKKEGYVYATISCHAKYDYICSSQSPKRVVLINNINIKAPYHGNITLNCEYESLHTVTKIFWRVKNETESRNLEAEVHADKGVTTYTLNNIKKENIGVYQCFVENAFGSRGSNEVLLDIIPELPYVTTNQTTIDVHVAELQKVTMFCFYDGYPEVDSVTWININKTENGNLKYERDNGISRLFLDGELEDSGTYICSVSNIVGFTNSSPIVLQVTTDQSYCPCLCEYKEKLKYWSKIRFDNYTRENLVVMLQSKLKALDKELRLDKKKLSSRRNRLVSQSDDRESSRRMGFVAIVFLSITFGLPVLIDLTSRRNRLKIDIAKGDNITPT